MAFLNQKSITTHTIFDMITKNYSAFFEALENNNNKTWFHANKKQYESDAKQPFLNLLSELMPTLVEWDGRIPNDEKKAMFRINRDVRFSKDKTPYHTILKAGFSPNGKKSMLPGYYLGIDAHTIHVGGGLFNVRPPELKLVRQHIADNVEDFLSITNNAGFKTKFGELSGQVSKRIDKIFDPVAKRTELIYKKQFYAMAQLPLERFYNNTSIKTVILDHFEAIKPINTFLGMTS